ncbi:hypothetical protein CFC21_106232 [Triticum aestivum]|uniref:Rx N-terminal domain-containing protein n=2 Tax=Triticum aestivum TaxID=4565 RepID=A0A3B6SMB2_WHEAT|nr:hypothetical protein CFC21_106232 [Triticum aestivum]
MDLATGAMSALLPKLVQLLKKEYKLQAGVRKDVEFLEKEMRSIDAALRKVARVRRDQLEEQVNIWADDVKELSYEMEDVVDRFFVHMEASETAPDPDIFRGFVNRVVSLFRKRKTHQHVADAIKDIKEQVHEVASRRDRYKVDDIVGIQVSANIIDPRMLALFKDKREIVGIKDARDDLIKRLTDGDDGISNTEQPLRMLSIFGFGGLGKTTLAKAVYDKLHGFDLRAFVPVGQNPDVKKVLMDILLQLGESSGSNITMMDEWQLIWKLRALLDNRRYVDRMQVS